MSHPIKSALILFFSILMLVAQHPVNGLKENEEVTDDFDTGTADFWQWTPGDTEENSTTIWHLSKHGDPPPFGIDAVRPPMEDDGGGYLEIVPFSDSPAQILSNVFDLLPYATVEMTYWNVVPIPVQGRNTVLILYLEFQNVTLNDETGIEPLRTVMVFKAPTPTDPSPGWTTATVDLPITEPCQVQLRIDGTRTDLPTTGLAVSKITVKNGVDISTTTSTTMSSTTTRAQSPSTESVTTPTRYAADKSTSSTSTTTPTTTPTSTSAPGATPPTSTTLDSSTVTSAASTEESTVSDLPTETISSDSPSSNTTTFDTSSPTTISQPQETSTSSSLSSIASTTTTPASSSLSSIIASTSTIVTTASTIGLSITATTIDLPTATGSTSKFTTTSSTTTSSAFSTRPTTSASMSSTDSTDPPTLTPPSGMTINQDVLIGVGVAILLFFLFCLLFTICYRRHRRRAYLIENRQLENGIIRSLEITDQFPYTIHKNESDSSSISSTTASDCPLAPKPPGQTSVKDLLQNFLRSPSSTSSKITKLT